MDLLLDTHALIWWDASSASLSPAAFNALNDPANDVWFSPVSIWEMQIKNSLGKLPLRAPLAQIIAEQQTHGLLELPVQSKHVLALHLMPPVHKDPFDRMLAAQAIAEGLVLITSDSVFNQYPIKLLW